MGWFKVRVVLSEDFSFFKEHAHTAKDFDEYSRYHRYMVRLNRPFFALHRAEGYVSVNNLQLHTLLFPIIRLLVLSDLIEFLPHFFLVDLRV